MTESLKKILFKIAQLPSCDQQWIVRRLSSTERNTLNDYNGLNLLQEAQRFRTLKDRDIHIPSQEKSNPLPQFCHELALKAPLYTAIVIEQGAFPWTATFLQQFDINGAIQFMLNNQVLDVKPVVKQAIVSEWEQSISFDCLLDESHG